MAPSEKHRFTIDVVVSADLKNEDWDSYTLGFNTVFSLKYPAEYFRHKYASPSTGYSYHALLKATQDPSRIVGALTAIPFDYMVFGKKTHAALIVDVFILEEFRFDPFSLKFMYQKIRDRLNQNDIQFVIAIPNDVAYPFWKNLMKWKTVGHIPYYILPLRAGTMLGKTRILNFFSLPFCFLLTSILRIFAACFSPDKSSQPIKQVRTGEFYKYRFPVEYHQMECKKGVFFYRMYEENGINIIYLVDFNPRSPALLATALFHLTWKEKADSILFIGTRPFFYPGWFRVPKKFEPKKLILMTDPNYSDASHSGISSWENWDFGLVNFDVR